MTPNVHINQCFEDLSGKGRAQNGDTFCVILFPNLTPCPRMSTRDHACPKGVVPDAAH